MTKREINLLNSVLGKNGTCLEEFYTLNIVSCACEKIKAPMFRSCFQNHHQKVMMEPQFTHIVGLGTEVAKYVFSRGKAPPSPEVLFGNPVKQFDLPGKLLFFVRHPSEVIEAMTNTKDDEEAFYQKYSQVIEDYEKLCIFLKGEALL